MEALRQHIKELWRAGQMFGGSEMTDYYLENPKNKSKLKQALGIDPDLLVHLSYGILMKDNQEYHRIFEDVLINSPPEVEQNDFKQIIINLMTFGKFQLVNDYLDTLEEQGHKDRLIVPFDFQLEDEDVNNYFEPDTNRVMDCKLCNIVDFWKKIADKGWQIKFEWSYLSPLMPYLSEAQFMYLYENIKAITKQEKLYEVFLKPMERYAQRDPPYNKAILTYLHNKELNKNEEKIKEIVKKVLTEMKQ